MAPGRIRPEGKTNDPWIDSMSAPLATILLLASLGGMVLLGRKARGYLPEDHLSSDSRDTVKLAMGLVCTMTALILGLLVTSAKETYNTQRSEILQMASKVGFLDRVLESYGSETAPIRTILHENVAEAVRHLWPEGAGERLRLDPDVAAGDRFYGAIEALVPHEERQRALKDKASNIAVELGQLRMLIAAQGVPSIPFPLLIMVCCWLLIIFLGFSLIAPPNTTTTLALTSAAVSVAGAVFLIMELDQPLDGMIRVSPEPMIKVMNQIGK
jgi:hypothetical protein